MGTSAWQSCSSRINSVYCTDTILDRERPETLDLTNQSIQRMNADREVVNNASPRRAETAAPERKQTLTKERERKGGMDAERQATTG